MAWSSWKMENTTDKNLDEFCAEIFMIGALGNEERIDRSVKKSAETDEQYVFSKTRIS